MTEKNEKDDCGAPCRDFERLNYHYGQIMTERDFRDQQRYYNEKRWMMNRYGIGWGVLHGFKVSIDLKPEGNERKKDVLPKIVIGPGLAIDQYGNEILSAEERIVDAAELLKPGERGKPSAGKESAADGGGPVHIAVRYRECAVEPFRLPEVPCCDEENGRVYSRTRETLRFIATRDIQEWKDSFEPMHAHDRTTDFTDLKNPGFKISQGLPERRPCLPVPLATLTFRNNRWEADNLGIRRQTCDNDRLFELIGELYAIRADGFDRRSFVPLLAQTIPGLRLRDGSTKSHDVGKLLVRVTCDGRHVWCTDSEDGKVHRISIENGPVNPSIELDSKAPGWGIAFHANAVWVTIPSKNAVERINVDTLERSLFPLCNQPDGGPGNPREIVSDGKYLWISHGQLKTQTDNVKPLQFTRLNPKNGESILFKADTGDPVSPVAGMAFDGEALWIAYNDGRNGATVQRCAAPREGNPQEDFNLIMELPIKLRGDNAMDIAFDGNAIWVTHDEGASKVGLWEKKDVAYTSNRGPLSAIAFDGRRMWMSQNQNNEAHLHQYDLFTLSHRGGYELSKGNEDLGIVRMCFDGTYLWVAGNKTGEMEKKGVIYRILP